MSTFATPEFEQLVRQIFQIPERRRMDHPANPPVTYWARFSQSHHRARTPTCKWGRSNGRATVLVGGVPAAQNARAVQETSIGNGYPNEIPASSAWVHSPTRR